MAGNMDENEIKGVSEAMNELREKGQLSADTLAKLGGNSTAAYKALEGYTKAILGAAGAVGGMAKTVADGEGSFKSLGSSITGLTGMIGKLASAIPLVGGAAKALAEGVVCVRSARCNG
jgi:NADPH-dependent curcumin reductase CurA